MSCLERGETSCEIQVLRVKAPLVADMLEPGGDSIAVVTRLTGTTQDSPTQSEGNAAHEAEQGEDTARSVHTGTTHHESWAELVSNVGTVAKRRCMCCRYMLPSDWLDCIGLWHRRETIPKGHCLGIFVIFWKRKRASLLCCSAELTDTLVVKKCSHWRHCWRLRELQKSNIQASHVQAFSSRCWLLGHCTSCAELIWATKVHVTTLTTIAEFPASHEPHSCWVQVEDASSNPLSTLVSWGSTFFDWPIASHCAFGYIQTDASSRYFKQHIQQPNTLEGAAHNLHVGWIVQSKWWERVILFSEQHTFSFRFLSLRSHSDCLHVRFFRL